MATAIRQQSAAIPGSFLEALKQGWRVVGEQSKLRGSYRYGTVTLEQNGCRVSVAFFADREGYHFGSVKVLA